MSTSEQRIYVACLAAYNNGYLHGQWIDLPADDLWSQVKQMLAQSPIAHAEEWAIHDYEGFDDISEYEDLDNLNQIATAMEEHGQTAVNAFIDYYGEWDEDKFTESYQGDYSDCFDPEIAFAEQLFDECFLNQIPDNLRNYIDYEKFSHDLFCSDYASHSGHIFNCNI